MCTAVRGLRNEKRLPKGFTDTVLLSLEAASRAFDPLVIVSDERAARYNRRT
jgi:hypothetical protein